MGGTLQLFLYLCALLISLQMSHGSLEVLNDVTEDQENPWKCKEPVDPCFFSPMVCTDDCTAGLLIQPERRSTSVEIFMRGTILRDSVVVLKMSKKATPVEYLLCNPWPRSIDVLEEQKYGHVTKNYTITIHKVTFTDSSASCRFTMLPEIQYGTEVQFTIGLGLNSAEGTQYGEWNLLYRFQFRPNGVFEQWSADPPSQILKRNELSLSRISNEFEKQKNDVAQLVSEMKKFENQVLKEKKKETFDPQILADKKKST